MNTLHIRGEPDFSFDIYFPVWGGGNKVPECELGLRFDRTESVT